MIRSGRSNRALRLSPPRETGCQDRASSVEAVKLQRGGLGAAVKDGPSESAETCLRAS